MACISSVPTSDTRKHPESSSRRKLTEEDIASLDALGFEWAPQSKMIKPFEERVEELAAYKAKHGHPKVKKSEDKSLYEFCHTVREARKGREVCVVQAVGEGE